MQMGRESIWRSAAYATGPLSGSESPRVTIDDRALYIYTSGTTGLPKAANISHARLLQWSLWFAGMMDTRTDDRMYNCLPMYHSVGGVLATGAVLAGGGSVVVRESFSARQFWPDVVRWDCTLVQYIGELCRYLVNADVNPQETAHRIRMCCGNGLRPDVWGPFKDRFRIPHILEFYAATEGNVSMFNVEGKPGAIGRVPPFLAHRFPTALIKLDVEAEQPVRNDQGWCIRCGVNEVGEAIGPLLEDRSNVGGRFEGYTSREASEKKILRDVFKPGDAWFRTGDLLRKDEKGYFYFVDRIGDTFRWKGENVATSEVSEALCTFPGITQANVYGVTIPRTDGRAGMAAIVASQELDLAALRSYLSDRLPGYARPLFLRISREFETTATFKFMKGDLVRQGFDPKQSPDPVYVDNREQATFTLLGRGVVRTHPERRSAVLRVDPLFPIERMRRGRARLRAGATSVRSTASTEGMAVREDATKAMRPHTSPATASASSTKRVQPDAAPAPRRRESCGASTARS